MPSDLPFSVLIADDVAKDAPWAELFEAIRKTLQGQSYISLGMAKRLSDQSNGLV